MLLCSKSCPRSLQLVSMHVAGEYNGYGYYQCSHPSNDLERYQNVEMLPDVSLMRVCASHQLMVENSQGQA